MEATSINPSINRPAKMPVHFSMLSPSNSQVVPTWPPRGTWNASHLLSNLQLPLLITAPCSMRLHLLPTASQPVNTRGHIHYRPPQARWVRCAPRNQCLQLFFFFFFILSVLKTYLQGVEDLFNLTDIFQNTILNMGLFNTHSFHRWRSEEIIAHRCTIVCLHLNFSFSLQSKNQQVLLKVQNAFGSIRDFFEKSREFAEGIITNNTKKKKRLKGKGTGLPSL